MELCCSDIKGRTSLICLPHPSLPIAHLSHTRHCSITRYMEAAVDIMLLCQCNILCALCNLITLPKFLEYIARNILCQFKDRFPVSSDMLLNVYINGTQFTAGASLFNNSMTILCVKLMLLVFYLNSSYTYIPFLQPSECCYSNILVM
jgi:hypothetical protein